MKVRQRADMYCREHRGQERGPGHGRHGPLELVLPSPGDHPRGRHRDRHRPGRGLPGRGQRLPGRIVDGTDVTAIPRAPRPRPRSPRVGGGVPGPRRRGVQRGEPGDARTPSRSRLPECQQVVHQPGAPPHHNGRYRLGSAPGDADGRLRRRAEHPRCLPGGRTRRPQTAQLAKVEEAAQANLDATLASLQATIGDRLIATADQAHAAAEPRSNELLWSIVIGLAIAGTCVAVHHPTTRSRVEHEQAGSRPIQSEITREPPSSRACRPRSEMSRAEPSVFESWPRP